MKHHERGGGRDFICGPKRLISQMNRFKIRNESNVARKLRFDRSPPAADAPGARMPKGQVPWASDKQRLAGGFGSMVDFFSPPPKPPQVGRPAGVPRKKRGRPPAAPVVGAADQNPSVVVVPTPVVDTTIAPPAVAEGALGFPAPKAKVKAIKAKVATRTNWGEGEALVRAQRTRTARTRAATMKPLLATTWQRFSRRRARARSYGSLLTGKASVKTIGRGSPLQTSRTATPTRPGSKSDGVMHPCA